MEKQKPKIFIGSSVEGLPVARAIQAELNHDASCIIWDQGFFGLNLSTLEGLMEGIKRFNFGIFVFSPDDKIEIRGESTYITRDNVIFEFGLFAGHLGRSRTFLVRSEQPMRVLGDLAGITVTTYRAVSDPSEWQASVGIACNAIRRAIETASKDFEQEMVKRTSPNLIYVLRHLDRIGDARPALFFRPAFHHFLAQMGEACAKPPLLENDGWNKVADYAFRYLENIGLVEKANTSEYFITALGKEVLESKMIHARYTRAFQVQLLEIA